MTSEEEPCIASLAEDLNERQVKLLRDFVTVHPRQLGFGGRESSTVRALARRKCVVTIREDGILLPDCARATETGCKLITFIDDLDAEMRRPLPTEKP